MTVRATVRWLVLGATLACLTSCASADSRGGVVTVAAASSMTDVLEQIADDDIEFSGDGIEVRFSFAASNVLATQVQEGAPIDVFVAADETSMAQVVAADLIEGQPVVFARASLALVTRPGNPMQIASLDDLVGVGVVSVCARDAPCGRLAEQVLADAEVALVESSVSRASSARAALNAVVDGDAVAALVFLPDALAAGGAVHLVELDQSINAATTYSIAILRGAADPSAASAFVDRVTGPAGVAVLRAAGFEVVT